MKKIFYLLAAGIFAGITAKGQDTTSLSMKPVTHIQVSNEMYQNHPQFYNKDNFFDNSKAYTTGNGTYWVPGYSNPANRSSTITNGLAPNTSVNPVNTYIQENLRTGQNTFIIPRNVIHR